jgi:recombination protein RecA
MLDLVLGGGYGRGRVVNMVGDRSSGKTLLAIEACANYAIVGDAEESRYAEAEAAFDHAYAQTIGMPEGVQFPKDQLRTVEDFYHDMDAYLTARKKKKKGPALYVLDSLDALSDTAEMDRDIDKGSFGAAKAKKMSEIFRKLTGDINDTDTTLFVISQIREKIGVMFGETKTRSGGMALNFYASQIIWLAEIGKIKKTVHGAERVVGVNVLCKTKKNKIAPPFRECEIVIYFNYGVDDEESMINWLRKNPKAGVLKDELDATLADLRAARKEKDTGSKREIAKWLRTVVTTHWMKIEDALKPTHSKYG